jgi:hypothetical protein
MAKTKTIYVAGDGKEFDDEAACDSHDMYLAEQAKIESYIAATKLAKAQAGLMRKHLAGYMSFLKTGKVPEPEAAADPEPVAEAA